MNPETSNSPDDDASLGRAFRISTTALFILIAIGTSIFFTLRKKPSLSPPSTTDSSTSKTTSSKIPEAKFRDFTAAAGITFVHNNGAAGDKLLPESMGGGVGFFDYDNDGDQDLLFINSTYWPDKIPLGKKPTVSALYQNDGKGSFKDVTDGSGLDVPIYGMAPAFGDYDNDGFVDILVTAVGKNVLFKNLGNGKFKDVTSTAGVAGAEREWSTAATWFDYDNDGDLDLFVANYIRWTPEIDLQVGTKIPNVGRIYGQPKDFEGTLPYLYRNDGGGQFMDVSAVAGIEMRTSNGAPAAKSLGVAPADVDGDGFLDLIVANDTVPNQLFHNQKNGTFKEIGGRSGVAYDSMGGTRGAMGIDVAKYREDASLAILIGNFANEMSALYVAQPGGGILFSDDALDEGIGAPSRALLTFGAFFFDFDLNGRLDILNVNGHLDEAIGQYQKGQQYLQPAQLFWNTGAPKPPRFTPVTAAQAGNAIFTPIAGRGSAYADIDSDGDQDVVFTQTGGKPLLLRNDQSLKNNWIRMKLTGTKSNHDAIGAWVRARIGGKDHWRNVTPTRSYFSQSELVVTFGLGKESAAELVEVQWPDGSTQQVTARPGETTVVTQL
jgi:hypothetical protein